VHTTDWRALGFADFMTVPPAGTGCARVEVDRWARFRRDNAAEPRPVVTELLRWLDSHAPDVPEVCLTWGDVGLGNFVVDDGRIVGLTDWEYAHLGDPMQDWAAAFLRGMDHLLPRDELFAIYEAESGIRVDEDRIRYHTVLVNTQYSVLTDPTLRHILDADGDHDISQVRATMGFLYACQRDAWVIVDTWP
jgi:aminoglycoside phosphotransferase (APT) family kinase protein